MATPRDRPARSLFALSLLPFLAFLFFFSGLSALIYQVLWLRMLGLVFGVTVYAASTVLASFMAGLALGSLIAGRLADRLRRPLAAFGLAEILVGACALLTGLAFEGLTHAYVLLGPLLGDSLTLVTLVRFLGSALVLVVPTALMGATLPLIVRSSLTPSEGLGPRLGLLYGINTAGAVIGTLAAGFWLIPALGIRQSFLVAACLNLLVGIAALAAARYDKGREEPAIANHLSFGPAVTGSRVVLAVFIISGFASLALEVIWFRVLVIFMQPTTYGFTIMLATMLAGIAAGSCLIKPFMPGMAMKGLWLAAFEMTMAFTSVLSFRALDVSFDIAGWLVTSPADERVHSLLPLLVAAVIAILPTALVMGAAFPLGAALYVGDTSGANVGRRIGFFYAMNTCGALGGALVAGFLLLPALGSRGALLIVASALMTSGLLLILDVRRRRGLSLALSATAVAAFVITALWTPDPFVAMLARVHPDQPLLWKMEGVQTTASVHLRDLGNAAPNRVLYLNGAHQANDSPPMAFIHHRIGYLPMALHPRPRRALVVGLGGGATAGSASRFPDVELDVIELAESVVQASEWFRPINFDLLHRSNAHLRIDDGRNYLMMTRKKYDVITADLILPVHAGANHLYSLEYFELVRRSLNEDGILLQWLYGSNRYEYSLLVRTFLRVFPDATAWADGTLFVGSRRPFTLSRDAFERKLQDPATRLVLESVGLGSFEALTSQFVAGPDTLRRYVGDGPILDDDRPLMEYFLSLPRDDRMIDLKEMRDDIGQVVR